MKKIKRSTKYNQYLYVTCTMFMQCLCLLIKGVDGVVEKCLKFRVQFYKVISRKIENLPSPVSQYFTRCLYFIYGISH